MSTQKLKSYLSRLSPIPCFPEYTGPYKVGSVDVEIPVSELDSPSPPPDAAADIHTVLFRIFYPATPDSKGPPISWLPAPKRFNVASYTQFLGINSKLASVIAFLPRHLYYIQIPVKENAPLQPPNTPNGRWPTAVFSHGLAGNRNTYSYLAGSLASHGVVVICPEHRDGSALSLIRGSPGHPSAGRPPRVVPYTHYPHTQTADVWRARDMQLRIRLWELGLLVEAVVGLGSGIEGIIRANMTGTAAGSALQQFAGKMDVHDPGKITWAGHSFGSATILQLLKLTYYADHPEVASMPNPAFTPRKDSNIRRLVTEKNPTILLDMWCLPIASATFAPIFKLPLPAYADSPTAPGGKAILAIESESFFKWTEQLHTTARILSADPTAPVISPAAYERIQGSNVVRLPEPNVFYVRDSAHLNQSDFGVLFPWLCKKAFGAEEPERTMQLNVRAILQHLRANDVAIAGTCAADLVDGAQVEGKATDEGVHDDEAILRRRNDASIEAWCWIDTMGMGEKAGLTELELLSRGKEGEETSEGGDQERQMEAEIEPGFAPLEAGTPVQDVKQAAVGAITA